MNTWKTLLLALCTVVLWAVPQSASAECTQTFSPGANLVSAVSTAASGSTLCLNDGDYGTLTLTNIARTDFVTLRSVNSTAAKMRPRLSNVDYVKFESMTLDDALVTGCSTNIHFIRNSFTVNRGLGLTNYGYTCTNYPANYVVDGNIFGPVGPSISEGRLDIRDVDGGQGDMRIVVRNNVFDGKGRCMSDGIQLTGSPSGVTIGPNNIFQNIVQDSSTVHCDSIQIVSGGPQITIDGNWFRDGSVVLQFHDYKAPGVRFTNNVITRMAQFWAYNSVTSGFVFEHNTIYNLTDVFQVGRLSSGVHGRSNILLGSTIPPDTYNCSGCTFGYNLGETASQAVGSSAIIGTPIFAGGSPGSITTFAGWQLASGSLGKGDGHDARDRGTLYYGPTNSTAAPQPATNIRVIR